MEDVHWIDNRFRGRFADSCTDLLSRDRAARAQSYHRIFPEYAPTPLRSLSRLAEHWGVSGVYVKDESLRFGLNSFKVLGGSYAIGRHLAKRWQIDERSLELDALCYAAEKFGTLTFIATTDGNHGRGVAWTAKRLGHRSIIYMPKGSSERRLNNIRSAGAEASITDMNYDDTVRMTAQLAEENGWVMVQDTAWEGYDEFPVWVMQGYLTMALESLQQLQQVGIERPTHILLQAGVGSFAGAVSGFFASEFGESCPTISIVEPHQAAPHYLSALSEDGEPKQVSGDLDTIMAGLACGEPNPIAWDVLRSRVHTFISCSDVFAARGMRILGNPLDDDPKVISGESGSVTIGLLGAVLQEKRLRQLKESLGLDSNSRVLVFNTEGDTDPDNYRRITWDGAYPYTGEQNG